ncbi:MAG: Bicarbonate transport ATP-binding protein CmpD [Chloroflexi bacterium ADurb.Bin222]|nr:MAG: Bicarbonate transport ATP-binding protein CmpD [Chloroflexi bacterium ADurb.Bin222]
MRVVLRNLSKTFSGRKSALEALAPISLDIASGEFVCFVGPSGCGKSTLLRLVADQLLPTTGEILLDGQSPTEQRKAKAIGWMAQNPALLPWSTVLENVRLPLQVNREHNRAAPTPEALLAMIGLTEFATAYPGTLSGGMQQRVALARTLATGAGLWLMDEPFAALDELTREALTDEVLRLWQDTGATVLWVTHNITEAVRLADRLVVLSARPGGIRQTFSVPLHHPRDPISPEVIALVRDVRKALAA